jgi:histidine triad (HIT) family protein
MMGDGPMDCLFCKIVKGEISARKIFEDDQAIAFQDIHPQAPVHLLIVPRRHIGSLAQIEDSVEDTALLGHLLGVVNRIAAAQELTQGYRTVVNTGVDGGQTVNHLHLHLLGGRAMEWPPG